MSSRLQTETRSGGQLLVSCLESLGVSHSFGVPGESYLAVLDALHDADINFTLCRQEGAASFASAAWGKLTGAPGICFVTRGPGATNASIGVHSAMQDSSPMILFIGQIGTDQRDREAFQEVDYRAFFGPIAKWATEIDDAERIPEVISHAWHIALSGRPGPVVIALPENMLTKMTDVAPCRPVQIAEAGVSHHHLAEALSLLSGAARPLVMAGGGGWNEAGKENLRQFAEASGLPVAAIFRYQDVMDNHSPAYIGDAGVGMAAHIRKAIKQADVILCLNGRFGEAATGAWELLSVPNPSQKIIHSHASDAEIGKVYQPDIAFHAGPNEMAAALSATGLPNGNGSERAGWLASLRTEYEAALRAPAQNSPVDMAAVMRHLQDVLPDDVIITHGAGNFALWPDKCFAFGRGQRLLGPQSGAMGYGFPAALAACVAYPERMVVCFAGDGDIQMGIAELGSAVQAGAKPLILVLNNGSYGTIRMHQERDYPGRVSGTTLVNPDFTGVAEAYGMMGIKVARTEEFAAAFKTLSDAPHGGILELDISLEAITPTKKLSEL